MCSSLSADAREDGGASAAQADLCPSVSAPQKSHHGWRSLPSVVPDNVSQTAPQVHCRPISSGDVFGSPMALSEPCKSSSISTAPPSQRGRIQVSRPPSTHSVRIEGHLSRKALAAGQGSTGHVTTGPSHIGEPPPPTTAAHHAGTCRQRGGTAHSRAAPLAGTAVAAMLLLPAPAIAALHAEPANALSLPTWAIHISSTVEWATAMLLFWQYADVTGNQQWKGLTWGMLPLLGGAMAACTYHFFYNAPELDFLVAIQAFLTVLGNATCAWAAYRIHSDANTASSS